MAQRIITTTLIAITALSTAACSEDNDGLDAGAIDAQVTADSGPLDVGVADQGPGDVGPTDTGLVDAAVLDGTVVRALVEHELVPSEDRFNRVLLPDFESRVVNGGWLAVPVTGGQVVPWTMQYLHNAPGARPEVAVITGTTAVASGTNFIGFAMASDQALASSVWLGSAEATPDWPNIQSGLIGYVDGMGTAVVQHVMDPMSEQRIDGILWRKYTVEDVQGFIGRVTFLVQNTSAEPIYFNAPFVGERLGINAGRRAAFKTVPASWRIRRDQWPVLPRR